MTPADPDELERRALDLVELALTWRSDERLELVRSSAADPRVKERALDILGAEGSAHGPIRTGAGISRTPADMLPESIGGYRVISEIGRGGMGVVYHARRTEQDFEIDAAIKVVLSDHATPRLAERLREERRTLARLKHPSIAQLYDGGETADGAPYFVMEYVAGTRLDRFLAESATSLEQRLDIFLSICRAVSFAHRNLIIHRDLSPANVLVSADEHVKLIDFGIAQSLNQELAEVADQQVRLTMTKAYAAPERLHGAPSTTASDIYSLGAILRDLIGDVQAPRRPDLIAVAAKAAADAPDDRYPSVDALMADVLAYQRGEVVSAVQRRWRYAAARFVGRHKVVVAMGTALGVSVLTGGMVLWVLYGQADAARLQANQRFDQVRDLARFIMFDLHDEVARLDGSTRARAMVTARALEYLDALSEGAGESKALKLELAEGYKRLSDVTGHAGSANLGQREEADRLLAKAASLVRELRETGADAAVLRLFATIAMARAEQQAFSGLDYPRGRELVRQAAEAIDLLGRRETLSIEDRLLQAHTDMFTGYLLNREARYDDAVRQMEEGLTRMEHLYEAHPDHTRVRMEHARAYVTYAEALSWQAYAADRGKQHVVPYFDRGVEALRALLKDTDRTPKLESQLIVALLKRANTTCYMPERVNEGIEDLKEAAALSERLATKDPVNERVYETLTHITIQRAACHEQAGDLDQALEVGHAALDRRLAQLEANPDNPGLLVNVSNTLWVLRSLYETAGDRNSACKVSKRLDDHWQRYLRGGKPVATSYDKERQENETFLADCLEEGLTAAGHALE